MRRWDDIEPYVALACYACTEAAPMTDDETPDVKLAREYGRGRNPVSEELRKEVEGLWNEAWKRAGEKLVALRARGYDETLG